MFAPTDPTPARGLELWVWQPPRQKLRKGNDRTSQVPGESSCAFALFFDPGRTDSSGHTTESARPPYWQRRRLLANLGSFEAQSHGLCTRCLRFALGIAPSGRKTRFPLLSALRDGIGYPQDSNERFPSCFLHLIPLSQACLTQCQPNCWHRFRSTFTLPTSQSQALQGQVLQRREDAAPLRETTHPLL